MKLSDCEMMTVLAVSSVALEAVRRNLGDDPSKWRGIINEAKDDAIEKINQMSNLELMNLIFETLDRNKSDA